LPGRLAVELPLGLGRQHPVLLDGDPDLQVAVPGAVDGAHAALAQLGVDAIVVVQVLPDLERHRCLLCTTA
jgi:hypothetical protein